MSLLERTDVATLAARFAARLRSEGLPVGPERTARFASAVTLADPMTTEDLYWCALATLVGDPSEIAAFDHVFGLVFGGMPEPGTGRRRSPLARAPGLTESRTESTPPPPSPDEEDPDRESSFRALATAQERLAGRDFSTLSPDELAQLVVLMRQLRLATPAATIPAVRGRVARTPGGPAHHPAAGPAHRRVPGHPGPAPAAPATPSIGRAVRHLGLDGAVRAGPAAAGVLRGRRPADRARRSSPSPPG
jgi:uncharacterized protein with von Willebrand factor type A (vWA) domain